MSKELLATTAGSLRSTGSNALVVNDITAKTYNDEYLAVGGEFRDSVTMPFSTAQLSLQNTLADMDASITRLDEKSFIVRFKPSVAYPSYYSSVRVVVKPVLVDNSIIPYGLRRGSLPVRYVTFSASIDSGEVTQLLNTEVFYGGADSETATPDSSVHQGYFIAQYGKHSALTPGVDGYIQIRYTVSIDMDVKTSVFVQTPIYDSAYISERHGMKTLVLYDSRSCCFADWGLEKPSIKPVEETSTCKFDSDSTLYMYKGDYSVSYVIPDGASSCRAQAWGRTYQIDLSALPVVSSEY